MKRVKYRMPIATKSAPKNQNAKRRRCIDSSVRRCGGWSCHGAAPRRATRLAHEAEVSHPRDFRRRGGNPRWASRSRSRPSRASWWACTPFSRARGAARRARSRAHAAAFPRRCAPEARDRASPGVVFATIRPRLITAMRGQRTATSLTMCVDKRARSRLADLGEQVVEAEPLLGIEAGRSARPR